MRGDTVVAIDKLVRLAEKVAAVVSDGVAKGLCGKDYAVFFSIRESADKLIVVQVSHKLGVGVAAHIDARCCMYDADGSAKSFCREDVAADIFYHNIIFVFYVLEARAFSVRLSDDEPYRAGVIAERLEMLEYLLIALAVDGVGICAGVKPTIHKTEVDGFRSRIFCNSDSLLLAIYILQSVYR